MKKILFTILIAGIFSLAQGQALRFTYNVIHNGSTSAVQVFVVKPGSGTENMTGYSSNLYYDSTESSISSFDISPSSGLGWSVDYGITNHVSNSNNAIPITHTGFATINVIDLLINGTNFGQTLQHILTINLDNTPGTMAASAVYLASTTENHPALEYVGNDFIGHPVIVQPFNSLPVEYLHFSAEALPNRSSYLKWSTAREVNNEGFFIERASPEASLNWEIIGFEKGNGTRETAANFEFIDHSPFSGENLYRLRQVDTDGAIAYSEIRSVWFDSWEQIQIYPNPVTDMLHVRFEIQDQEQQATYILFDKAGRTLQKGVMNVREINQIEMSLYPEGSYILQIDHNGRIKKGNIVKVE